MKKKTYSFPTSQSIEFACKDTLMGIPVAGSETRPGSGALSSKRAIDETNEHAIWKE
ncbi:MAG: hypothetical protein IIW85_01510 [Bacteroidaceae bacterium]|nr:hypothetical protein [Bacteroidaceae bacterium]